MLLLQPNLWLQLLSLLLMLNFRPNPSTQVTEENFPPADVQKGNKKDEQNKSVNIAFY